MTSCVPCSSTGVQEHEKRTGRRFPSVELYRAVQLWLQRQGWQPQFEPTDIVVNDVMVVHPDVDGDMVARVCVESAEQWDCINDAGFRAAAPDEFEALHFMRKRRGGESSHVAVVVVNRDNRDVYVEVCTRDQLNDAARSGTAKYVMLERIPVLLGDPFEDWHRCKPCGLQLLPEDQVRIIGYKTTLCFHSTMTALNLEALGEGVSRRCQAQSRRRPRNNAPGITAIDVTVQI